MVQKIIRYKPFKYFWKETKIELEENDISHNYFINREMRRKR